MGGNSWEVLHTDVSETQPETLQTAVDQHLVDDHSTAALATRQALNLCKNEDPVDKCKFTAIESDIPLTSEF